MHHTIRRDKLKRRVSYRSTSPRPETHTARASSAVSIRPTRLPSTRPVRLLCTPRVRDVTTVSSPVMVVRPSLSSTRRPRLPRRLSFVLSAPPASTRCSFLSSAASTLSWVVIRRPRVLPLFSKQHNKHLINSQQHRVHAHPQKSHAVSMH